MNSTPAGAPLTSSTSARGIGPANPGDIPAASASSAIRVLIIARILWWRPFHDLARPELCPGIGPRIHVFGIESVDGRGQALPWRPNGFDLIENVVAYTLRLLHPRAFESSGRRPARRPCRAPGSIISGKSGACLSPLSLCEGEHRGSRRRNM